MYCTECGKQCANAHVIPWGRIDSTYICESCDTVFVYDGDSQPPSYSLFSPISSYGPGTPAVYLDPFATAEPCWKGGR